MKHTAGVETQLPGAVRVGAMFYYRTNRDQIGQVNTLQPASRLYQVHGDDPERSRRHARQPEADDSDVYNISTAANHRNANVRDNVSYLDTDYKGIEFTATKRFSKKWQMQTGFTLGKNTGGINNAGGQSSTADLNDPNNTQYPDGHHRQRLRAGVPPVGQLHAAVGHQPAGIDDRQQRLSVRVDLLADPRRRCDAGHHADPRQPDDPAEQPRRRALSTTS